jgi:hypothetical protein
MIGNPRRNELADVPFLNNALDFILARWNALFNVEHDEEGHHTEVTADSLDVAGDVTLDGDLTASGDVHTLGEFVFRSGPNVTQESLTIGGDLVGWRIARKAASSPLNGTFAFALTDMASPNFPVLEIGTVAGAYYILPHDSASVNFGHPVTSSDRIASVNASVVTVPGGTLQSVSSIARFSGDPNVVLNNGVLDLGTNAVQGILTVLEVTNGNYAMFTLRGGTNSTQEITDPSGVFTGTAGTPASTNVYWSAGNTRYELQNTTGGTVTYRLFLIGV